MQASRFEYRFRFALHALIYLLGFLSPWLLFGNVLNMEPRSTWLVLSSAITRLGWLTFPGAVLALIGLALVLTGAAALLRVWGAAYVGSGVVRSASMHGEALLADGPYRHTRNPLYLGTMLHTIGISLLMPPSGAILAVVLLIVLNIRLALAEEPFLRERFGEAYVQYCSKVPRFLPTPSPQVPSAGQRPHWGQAVLGELYFVGAFLTLAIFGWDFNASPLRRDLLICLGLAIVVRAFLPPAPATDEAAIAP
ncbi:Protein-S-isoprenylcysteine O-methyltransferase Ste14 [Bryocella elongata]|uniref:Protein-S-isoprenylcysteine O-methyltransferase Ste14 n=1 Tax=Bryocella elongata TaxID=863522 RepID=A0A1H5Y1B7_9BACT|nr:isoprenylcysteine carboxylmethyltransferase family protein [Bryocella elongata]SEG17652.1 Protein-S-isoprenylcysteine O-methyltransferase Ste14 [Bryocella elongata]